MILSNYFSGHRRPRRPAGRAITYPVNVAPADADKALGHARVIVRADDDDTDDALDKGAGIAHAMGAVIAIEQGVVVVRAVVMVNALAYPCYLGADLAACRGFAIE